jgi:excisionase family DNA binding protein
MINGQFTVEEAAARLGLSRHQVYRLIASQQLPASLEAAGKLRYLITPVDLEEYESAAQTRRMVGGGNRPQAMLRVPDVAAMLGFSQETVRRMCNEGDLPYVRGRGKGGHFRIPLQAAKDYANRHQANAH